MTAVIDVSDQHEGLRKIALGFDFDFHPVCLLEDSFSDRQHLDADLKFPCDWSSVLADDVEWDQIIEGSRVYRRKTHDGVWAVKGHRLHGLDVLLSESLTSLGSLVTLKRDENRSQLIWEIHIDNLVGPFRDRHPRVLRGPFGSRWDFQKAYGLDDTSKDMEDGDGVLKAMFPSIGHVEPAKKLSQLTFI